MNNELILQELRAIRDDLKVLRDDIKTFGRDLSLHAQDDLQRYAEIKSETSVLKARWATISAVISAITASAVNLMANRLLHP